MTTTRFLSTHILEVSTVPLDTNGAAVVGDRYNLKGAEGIVFLISQGAWAGGTPAVTLTQSQGIAGTPKALPFSEKYSKVALTGTVNTRQAVVADTFNLGAANRIEQIEISAEDLDRDNGYDSVGLNIASPGANADQITVLAMLYGLRYGNLPTALYDPKVD